MSSVKRRLRRSGRKRPPGAARVGPDGRTHLVVVGNPATGQEFLKMSEALFEDDWQNRIATATANTCYAMLRDDKSELGAAAVGEKTLTSGSTLIDGLLARAPEGALACASGCDHCCHQSVGVTPPEALAIQRFLLTHLEREELQKVAGRVSSLYAKTRGLSAPERMSAGLPCPFLVEHRCSIYPVRPLSCRGMNSLDANLCEARLHDSETRNAYFSGRLAGHSFVEPIKAFHALSAGMQLALSECFRLDMRPLDLNAALATLLNEFLSEEANPSDPSPAANSRRTPQVPTRTQRWLEGEAAFADLRGGDASDQTAQWRQAGVRGFEGN